MTKQRELPSSLSLLRLTEREAAHYLAMSRPWLRYCRMKKKGPSFLRQGRAIRYDVRDLDKWLEKNRIECA